MPRPYSGDMRQRVIGRVDDGASRRDAAEHFEISASSAIRWVQRYEETGSWQAKPVGGSVSPLEEHASVLLVIVKEMPDITLDEMVVAIHKRKIAGSRTALWRFFARRGLTFKKKLCARPNKSDPTWQRRGGAGSKPKAYLTQRGLCLSTRRRPTQK